MGFRGRRSAFQAGLGSCGRSSTFEPGEPLEITNEVGHSDLDGGAGDADGAHDETHAVLLPGEHMLDMSADFGSPGIGLGNPLGHRPPRLAPLVDMALEHAGNEQRLVLLQPIGGIRPDARAVGAIADRVRQRRPVMSVGGTGTPVADQAVGFVDADMVLIAEHRDGEIGGLRGLGIGALANLGFVVLD